MIRTLQKKFIITAMTAVSVLLVVVLGAVNTANCILVSGQGNRMLDMLSEHEGMPPLPLERKKGGPEGFLNPPVNEDTAMSARYFLVRLDQKEAVVSVDTSRIASVSEGQAKEYAALVMERGSKTGRVERFRYQYADARDGREKMIVFLDISGQRQSILAVLFLSACIGFLCWALMLLLVAALSRKAIRPIAEGMEKQKQFVTDAGHEIKTPLAIILANTDALELHQGETKWSWNIRSQTLRLSGLMQNLLTLARMEEGGMKLEFSDFSFTQLLHEMLPSFAESAEQKEILIHTETEQEVLLRANRESIQRLVSILLDNAVKYTSPDGRIDVALKKNDRTCMFQVKNTCTELPEGDPDRLFDRFYRGDAARTQKSGGYGIGLSAARAIVEAHQGTITAGYGNGGTVIFTVII